MVLNDQWVTGEIKNKIKNFFELNKNTNIPKPVGYSKSSTKRDINSIKCLH